LKVKKITIPQSNVSRTPPTHANKDNHDKISSGETKMSRKRSISRRGQDDCHIWEENDTEGSKNSMRHVTNIYTIIMR
jgi:hypothetical protein